MEKKIVKQHETLLHEIAQSIRTEKRKGINIDVKKTYIMILNKLQEIDVRLYKIEKQS